MPSQPAEDPRSFDSFAAVYDRFAALTGDPLRAYLRTALPDHGSRALDAGCGTGRHTVLLADRFDEVLAVDLSKPMLDLARQHRARPNVTYDRCDLGELYPGRDGRFDLVLSVHTLHHVPQPELHQALRGLRDLVAPGGFAMLIDIVDSRGRVTRWQHRAYAARRLASDLLRGGPGRALEIYGACTHPAWLAHVATDRFLSPGAFRAQYAEVFPGAAFTRIDRALALTWQAPPTAASRKSQRPA
jgi:ubiquinone/menaquinone biosynthesis C-methylase UbiE